MRSAEHVSATRLSTAAVWLLPGVLSTGFALFAFLAARPVLTPDSGAYIELALYVLEHGRVDAELFQFYTPGYPLLLAGVFRIFGTWSGTALLALQHLMLPACALLVMGIAWHFWPRGIVVASVGVCCGLSLHLAGYARAVLTEMPYALCLTACVFLLVRHVNRGGLRTLLAASVLAGLATWFRPTGQLLCLACAAAALLRARTESATVKDSEACGNEARRTARSRWACLFRAYAPRLAAGVLPALGGVTAIMFNNYLSMGQFRLTCNDDMSYYVRAYGVERLDTAESEALHRIKAALEVARNRGWIDPSADHHDVWTVIRVGQRVLALSYPETGELMRQAGRDALREHQGVVAWNTLVYSYRNLVVPDRMYRMVPGIPCSPERGFASAEGLLAADTYRTMVTDRIGEERLTAYFPAGSAAMPTTGWWSTLAAAYHRRVESSPPPIGLLDTPYEEWMLLPSLGFLILLVLMRWDAAMLLGFVLGYHVVGQSFFGGVEPRYVIPLQPLISMLTGVALAGILLGLQATGSVVRHSIARRRVGRAEPFCEDQRTVSAH